MRALLLFLPLSFLAAQNTTPVENEFVRVVVVADKPVAKPGSLHEHKQNRVMIYLDPGDITIRYADGRVDNQHWKAGDIAWSPAAGMHTSQNVTASPTAVTRIVEMEIRTPAVASFTAMKNSVIDNAQVRVYKSARAPAAGKHFIAVDTKAAAVVWDKLPDGAGPFVITELK